MDPDEQRTQRADELFVFDEPILPLQAPPAPLPVDGQAHKRAKKTSEAVALRPTMSLAAAVGMPLAVAFREFEEDHGPTSSMCKYDP